jgi:RNA polymerase sigma-70 factor, ECF subfamily
MVNRAYPAADLRTYASLDSLSPARSALEIIVAMIVSLASLVTAMARGGHALNLFRHERYLASMETTVDTDDHALLRAMAAGDRDALAELYERHGQAVFALLVLVTGDRPLSEEILQDTMLAAWRGAAGFRGDSAVRSWLVAIANRQARDRLRRRRFIIVDDQFLSETPAAGSGPEQYALRRAETAAVAAAIGELNPIHREVLSLVFGANLTMAETADLLKVPLGTVKSRLSAARAALALAMTQRGYAR